MVITELDYGKQNVDNYNKTVQLEESEQLFKKDHHNILNKILRSNPFDLINDIFLKILKTLNLREQFHELSWWAAYVWAKEAMRRLWSYRVEVVDKGLPPEYGPGIIVGNHQSHLDPFFIGGSVQHRIHWMSKEENFQTPIVRSLFKNLGAFKLKRGASDQKAWEKAKNIIRNGGWVGIFPEGTRTDDGSLGEFRTGAIRLAVEMTEELGDPVPILPTGVIGSRNALPKGKLVMKPTKVKVRVGKAIYYDKHVGNFSYPIAKRLAGELREIIGELRDGNNPYEPEDQFKKLSIGSPRDIESKSKSSGFKGKIKRFGMDFLQLIDDSWYAFLKSLEVFGQRYQFQETIQNFSGNIVNALSDLAFPYKIIDYDKYIPKEGAALVCCNHNSEWDVIILATSLIYDQKRVLYQMAKQSLFKFPVVNAWIRSHHAFPLKRGESDMGSYLYARDRLQNDQLVVVYPEGTTNSGGGELLRGHTGAMRLAIESKVPIVLIGITGTENIFPKHAKMLNFGKGCILKAGEPFMEHQKYWGKEMPSYEELQRLTNNMMDRIKNLLCYDDPDA